MDTHIYFNLMNTGYNEDGQDPMAWQTSLGFRLLLTMLSMMLGSSAPRTTSHTCTRSGLRMSPSFCGVEISSLQHSSSRC